MELIYILDDLHVEATQDSAALSGLILTIALESAHSRPLRGCCSQ